MCGNLEGRLGAAVADRHVFTATDCDCRPKARRYGNLLAYSQHSDEKFVNNLAVAYSEARNWNTTARASAA